MKRRIREGWLRYDEGGRKGGWMGGRALIRHLPALLLE